MTLTAPPPKQKDVPAKVSQQRLRPLTTYIQTQGHQHFANSNHNTDNNTKASHKSISIRNGENVAGKGFDTFSELERTLLNSSKDVIGT